MSHRMVASAFWCCLLALVAAQGPRAEEAPVSVYGGRSAAISPATGWFRTAREDGRWWLVDPAGRRFLSIGVNHVSYAADMIRGTDRSPYREAVSQKYGPPPEWADPTIKRLKGWGFNTIGAWSDPITWRQQMPYTVILDFARQVKWQEGQQFPDVFSPDFAQAARRTARRVCRPLADDPWLIGYFTDNELHWGPDWRTSDSLFAEFLKFPDPSPGRRAVLNFLARRYLTIDQLNEDWGAQYESFAQIGRLPQVGAHIPQDDEDGFLLLVADRYFTLTQEAIRAADPNHLILGCRFAGAAPKPVLEAMKDHVDVVSLNHYDVHPPRAALRDIHRLTGCPVILTEFSYRGRDSGLPNTRGAGVVVDTQQDRAESFARYVQELIALPMVVGYHWFEHADEPAEGRFDGEDSNYGLVNLQDEPYPALVETMSRINDSAYQLAAGSPRRSKGD